MASNLVSAFGNSAELLSQQLQKTTLSPHFKFHPKLIFGLSIVSKFLIILHWCLLLVFDGLILTWPMLQSAFCSFSWQSYLINMSYCNVPQYISKCQKFRHNF